MEAILGYLVAVVLSMLMLGGFVGFAKQGVNNIMTSAAAGQMLIFDKAAAQYISDNATTLAAQATATVPVSITFSMLSLAQYLPPGFPATNVYQQTWLVQVLQPQTDQLESLVTTQGTPTIPIKQMVQIAAQIGAQGGFIPYANQGGDATMSPSNANGVYGGWKVPLTGFTSPGSGHLASLLAFTSAQLNGDYLYRVAVPGQPKLNEMNTNLNMGSQSITNAAAITAASAVTGASFVAVNGTGSTSLSNDGSGNTDLYQTGALQVLQSGTSAYAAVNAGNVTSSGSFKPGNIATPRTACSPNGAIASDVDGSGLPLVCQFGQWLPIGGPGQRYNYYTVVDGSVVPAPECPGGGLPQIVVSAQNFTVDSTAAVNFSPVEGTGPWTVQITDGGGVPIAGTATAETYCTF